MKKIAWVIISVLVFALATGAMAAPPADKGLGNKPALEKSWQGVKEKAEREKGQPDARKEQKILRAQERERVRTQLKLEALAELTGKTPEELRVALEAQNYDWEALCQALNIPEEEMEAIADEKEATEEEIAAAIDEDLNETLAPSPQSDGNTADLQQELLRWQEKLQEKARNRQALLRLAQIYRELGDDEKALTMAEEAVEYFPEDKHAKVMLAKILLDEGRTEEAAAILIALKGDKNAHAYLGILKEKAGQLQEAVGQYEEALALDPAAASLYKKLGDLYQKLGDFATKVFVFGERVKPDVPPQIINGRTMVPFRAIAERFAAEVNYDPEKQTITVVKGDTTVVLTIGSATATINGEPVTLDVPAQIVKNRTLVPLRFLSEAFGTEVDYDPEAQMVIVEDEEAPADDAAAEQPAPAADTGN